MRKVTYGGANSLDNFIARKDDAVDWLLWTKEVAWIQPPDADAGSTVAALSLPQVLEISRTVPEAEVRSWDDISRVDFRPSKNLIKVITKNAREIQPLSKGESVGVGREVRLRILIGWIPGHYQEACAREPKQSFR